MSTSDRTVLIDGENPEYDRDSEIPRGEDTSSEGLANNEASNNGEPVKYTSQLAAFLITINVTIGAGLLAMPFAIQAAGLVTSIIIQLIFLVLIIITCIMSTELTVKTNVDSYHKVIQAHCHPYVYQSTQVALLLMVFGAVVAFIVIIGDQSDRVFASVYGPTFCYTWYMNRRFVMSIVTFLFIKPLCCAKTVDFLKYGSFLGVASLGFIIYVVSSEFVKQGHIATDVNYIPNNWMDIASVLPVFCFAYQCHLSWVPTAATMRKSEKYTTYKTISIAMIVATIIYITVCVLAVLTFGSHIFEDLTESYPDKKWPIITTIAIVAFKCVVTLPPAFLPARLSLVDLLSQRFERFDRLSDLMKRIIVVYVTLSTALGLALSVPNIMVAVNILGCLAVSFIFTLPGLSYLNLVKENRMMKQQLAGLSDEIPEYSAKDKIKIALSKFFIGFGIFLMFVVLYKSIEKTLSSSTSQPLCHHSVNNSMAAFQMGKMPMVTVKSSGLLV